MLQRIMLLCLLGVALPAIGQTRYISDNIPVTLRTGPSLENRIVRNLSAGVRVEALETDEDSGYTRVRVASDGTEGWVLTRYLLQEPIARDRLAVAERELATARSRIAELEAQVAALGEELDAARGQLKDVTATSKEITTELQDIRAASANAIELRDQNDELRRRLAEADHRINRLTMEQTELASDSRRTWFMAGAGVLLAGMVIGLVAPSLRRRRRSSW